MAGVGSVPFLPRAEPSLSPAPAFVSSPSQSLPGTHNSKTHTPVTLNPSAHARYLLLEKRNVNV